MKTAVMVGMTGVMANVKRRIWGKKVE